MNKDIFFSFFGVCLGVLLVYCFILISFDVNPIKENRCENVVISDFNISNPECRVNSELWILFWGDTEYDCDCVNVDSYCNNNHCSKRPDGIKFNLR